MLIKVKVKVKAKVEKLDRLAADRFAVSVREPAKDGRANGRVLELLNKYFGAGRIRLVVGHTKPSKIFEIM